MKLRVTMKDPDTLHDSIMRAAEEWAASIADLDADEREAVAEKRADKLSELAGKWFEHGEYLTVEIDTEAGTASVVPRGK